MKKSTKLRLFGGAVLLFNLWLIGQYRLEGIAVILLTFGFAIGYEYLVVRPVVKSDESKQAPERPEATSRQDPRWGLSGGGPGVRVSGVPV